MDNDKIQLTIGTVMTVSAVGGPAVVVAAGAGAAVLLAGYGIYKWLSSQGDQNKLLGGK
jgi:hypothetical protein